MENDKVLFSDNGKENYSVNIVKPKSKTQSKNSHSICLFERSTGNTVNLKYDSKVLEDYYQECSLPHAVYRFRFSALLSILICIVWIIYFFIKIDVKCWYIVGLFVAMAIYGGFIGVTFANDFFKKWHSVLYILLGLFLSICSLLPFITNSPSVSLIFNLFFNVQVILLLYTTVPVRLWQAILLSSLLSLIFIILVAAHYALVSWRLLCILILINLVSHEVGLVHHLMSQARRRSTFLKLGLSAKLKGDIKSEQKSKEEMIKSLMPADVAKQVMSGQVGEESTNKEKKSKRSGSKRRRQSEKDEDSSDEEMIINSGKEPRKSTQIDNTANEGDIEPENNSANIESPPQTSLVSFRKFHVSQMQNVSILFADIVGFTKMSSNKTAPHLVFLLNDLFGSFDQLCERNGCEKIATLGDCYYCVSGCPKEEVDHAERCVEMGRSMCHAIRQFDERHNQEVNMRVGVHTGMVICGIVGTHRFKFDVWSHDVTLANEMESSGQAGRVHISQETYAFVKDIYEVEEAQSVPDIRKLKVLVEYFDEKSQSYAIKHEQDQASIMTYFILRRFDDKSEILLLSDEDNVKNVVQFSESQTEEMAMLENEKENNLSQQNNDAATACMLPETNEKLRQESMDMEMVTCFKEESANQIRSFFEPPINYFTLNFTDPAMQLKYQRIGLKKHKRNVTHLTWASLRVTPFINAVVSCVFVIAIIAACFIGFPCERRIVYPSRVGFYVSLVLTVLFNLIFVIPLIIDFVKLSNISRGFDRFYRMFFNWYFRNLYGIIVIGMPSVLVLCHFQQCWFQELHFSYRLAMGIMLLFMLCNCTLFTIYSSWTKSCIATVLVAVSLGIIFNYRAINAFVNCGPPSVYLQSYTTDPTSQLVNSSSSVPMWMKGNSNIDLEIVVVLLLTLVFILYLNREMDISFRATFSCDHQAVMARKAIAQERQQADWLLENIIPSYVIEDIKKYKKYSKHIEQVGVIFATIANFGDFYDEQFEGGREMLRVLNEIFADFENLLTNPKYKDVQKIKTIGACFMVASGLNPNERAKDRKSKAHLHALMDFSSDLISTLNAFNEQLFNFNFELKIGYNIGDVTAGVIGTTKLLYDIWGDTVNVASRMYSTGEKGRIQVTEAVAKELESRYDFKYRGEVEVKGKGKMQTYLLEGKKKKDNVSPAKQQ